MTEAERNELRRQRLQMGEMTARAAGKAAP